MGSGEKSLEKTFFLLFHLVWFSMSQDSAPFFHIYFKSLQALKVSQEASLEENLNVFQENY